MHSQSAYAVGRGTNPVSNLADGIFADSLGSEIITPTGDVASGCSATFQMGIAIEFDGQ